MKESNPHSDRWQYPDGTITPEKLEAEADDHEKIALRLRAQARMLRGSADDEPRKGCSND